MVQTILTSDLNTQCVATKSMLKILMLAQKVHHVHNGRAQHIQDNVAEASWEHNKKYTHQFAWHSQYCASP